MQPRLFIKVLVLQPERLMCIPIDPPILFQTTPGGVFTVPEEIAVLARDADFVAVEVVGLLAIFRRLRWSSCIPVPRGRSCRIVSIGNDSMVFTVVERPFLAEVAAAF